MLVFLVEPSKIDNWTGRISVKGISSLTITLVKISTAITIHKSTTIFVFGSNITFSLTNLHFKMIVYSLNGFPSFFGPINFAYLKHSLILWCRFKSIYVENIPIESIM